MRIGIEKSGLSDIETTSQISAVVGHLPLVRGVIIGIEQRFSTRIVTCLRRCIRLRSLDRPCPRIHEDDFECAQALGPSLHLRLLHPPFLRVGSDLASCLQAVSLCVPLAQTDRLHEVDDWRENLLKSRIRQELQVLLSQALTYSGPPAATPRGAA